MLLRIREICKQKGLLFKELAARLGVSDISLRTSLKGNPTVATLAKIADVLNVPVWHLLATDEEVNCACESSGASVKTCPHCGKPIKVDVAISAD